MSNDHPLKIFISAGEASGDLHGADLTRQLIAAAKADGRDASITFLGGDMMAEAVGHQPLIHYRDMAYMGFAQVLRHLPDVKRNLYTARRAILDTRPDALVLIDYPSFNLRLAKLAKSLGIKVFWYISPKVWAWKEHRIKAMRQYCDLILSILPFEVDYFSDKRLNVKYVGNPSVEEVDRRLATLPSRAELNLRYGLDPNRPLLTLVPGSRKGEIKGNLPLMVDAALRFPHLQPVVAAAPGIDREFYNTLGIKALRHMPVIAGDTFTLMAHSDAALVTSGTATLECALVGTPQVVCYRSSGSRIFYNIMSRVLKCPHISLPNLIANGLRGERFANEVVPELLLHHCNSDEISAALAAIVTPLGAGGASLSPGRQKMLDGYRRMRANLSAPTGTATSSSLPAAATAARLILENIR